MILPKSEKAYPKQLQIRDNLYEIKFVDRIAKTRTVLGECDSGDHIIRICRKQTPDDMWLTFIHEVIHAIEAEWSVKISHKAVYSLEKGIGQFLVDNF
jgi:hypothetical protein